jgi:nitrogen-specific signal transduction histidine kinase/CheY-like chemotaxis protein
VNRRLNREIEENQRTAAELDQSRKMEAVGRLTAGVAHDFNNLLSVILANLELIARRSDREDVRRFAGTAIDAVESGAQLTASMVAFSRKQVLKPQPVDLNALVGRTMALLTRSVDSSVTLSFARKPGVFPTQVDAAQLQNALLNLTCNARDAIAERGAGRGEIRLTIDERVVAQNTRLSTGCALVPGRYVEISVADNGSGIAPDILDKVFEPFFTTKAVGRGTGLGLAQVFGFVTQSGGAVDVESHVGVGTRFVLLLPYFDGPLPEIAETSDWVDGGSPRNLTVLMVDDSAAILTALSDAVAAEGWEVLTASDGDAALRMLEQHRGVDMLITDLDMPGRTGRELIDAIRRTRPELPIISMSGTLQDEMPTEIRFMAKPFAPRMLVDLIRTTLASLPVVNANGSDLRL